MKMRKEIWNIAIILLSSINKEEDRTFNFDENLENKDFLCSTNSIIT